MTELALIIGFAIHVLEENKIYKVLQKQFL